MNIVKSRVFFEVQDAGVAFGMPVFLIIEQGLGNNGLFVEAHYPEGTRRVLVHSDHKVRSARWLVDENNEVLSVLCYEDSGHGQLLSLRPVSSEDGVLVVGSPIFAPSPFTNVGNAALRAQKVGWHILLVSVDTQQSVPTLTVALLHVLTLAMVAPLAYVEDSLNGGCSYRYADEFERQMNTELTLVRGGSEVSYVQVLNGHGTLSTFSIDVSTGRLDVQYLFAVDQSGIGSHATAYAPQEHALVTCYAKQNGGDIYGVHNRLFAKAASDLTPLMAPIVINDSPGKYFRPKLSRTTTGLLVSWEGDAVHAKEINYSVIPIAGEFVADAERPGNARIIKYHASYYAAYQVDCVEPRQVGLSYQSIKRGVSDMEK